MLSRAVCGWRREGRARHRLSLHARIHFPAHAEKGGSHRAAFGELAGEPGCPQLHKPETAKKRQKENKPKKQKPNNPRPRQLGGRT